MRQSNIYLNYYLVCFVYNTYTMSQRFYVISSQLLIKVLFCTLIFCKLTKKYLTMRSIKIEI